MKPFSKGRARRSGIGHPELKTGHELGLSPAMIASDRFSLPQPFFEPPSEDVLTSFEGRRA
jgi:hypothetical protein